MKRLFFILAAVLMTASMMAETAIQNTFMGLTLGAASQDDVHNVLNSQGFELVSVSGTSFTYKGNWQIEGVPVNHVYVFYINDTLSMISFDNNSCEDQCDSLQKIIQNNVENKYGLLQSISNTSFMSLAAKELMAPEMEQWARMDNNTSFLYAKTDTRYVLMYVAEKFMGMQFDKLISDNMKNSPDYAEENKVTGVAGVKFGDSKETVRKVIYNKAQDLLESDEHSLSFYKVKIGGITYDYATFYFAEGKGLISVNMQLSFYSWREEEAKIAYENVVSQFSRKYTNFKVLKDDPDEKASSCGAFIEGYDYKPILITFQKSLSRGGDIMYYIQVDYYHERKTGMYDDEI